MTLFAPICWVLLLGSEPTLMDWPTDTPEHQGISSGQIKRVFETLRRERVGLHSLLVVRKGKLVFEAYAYPFTSNNRHDLASCTKTVTATLVGIAKDDGAIKGVDQSVVSFFPARTIARLDDAKKAVRIEDLLTMRSGFVHINEAIFQMQLFQSADWVKFCLDMPVNADATARKFQYFNGNSHLLSAIVHGVTSKSTDDFAKEKLFGPMGIDSFEWPRDPQGVPWGWGDLRLRPRDMAKLGQLFLDHGQWRGQRIVSTEWIEEMIKPRTETGRKYFTQYGYQIWRAGNSIQFRGRGGQRIAIFPEQDLVIVATTGTDDAREVFLDQAIADLASSALPAGEAAVVNGGEAEQLAKELVLWTKPPVAVAPSKAPNVAMKLLGHPIRLTKNLYVEQLELTMKSEAEGELKLTFSPILGTPPLKILVGFDGVTRLSPGRHGEPAACVGHWEGAKLLLDFDELGNINHWNIDLEFLGDELLLTMKELTGLPAIKAKGRISLTP